METFPITVIKLLVHAIVKASLLWCGMKIIKEEGNFRVLMVVAFIATLFGFIPVAGKFISFVVLLVLISMFTTADFFPSGFLMVLIANFLGLFLGLALIGMLGV